MSQSRRERLLAFVISVVLCCMMSGSLSLIARKSRDTSVVSTRTARLAKPHDDDSMPLPDEAQFIPDGSPQVSENQYEITGTVRTTQALSGGIMTAAILCLGAAMCCAITAVGALMLLRGPRRSDSYVSEDEDSDSINKIIKPEDKKIVEKDTQAGMAGDRLVWDEVDEISPEEAV